MFILFSPSEGKRRGGEQPPLNSDSFFLPELYETRIKPAKAYNDFLAHASLNERAELIGLKDRDEISRFSRDLFDQPTVKAVRRYEGVAYDYLQYDRLDRAAQTYIDTHTIIFSNVFGPLLAGDLLPEYKLKQGAKLPGLSIERYFKEQFTPALNAYLEGHDIVDLRAGFYEKFYTVSAPFVTFKFIKNGKVVSHWAKAYRGVVLKEMAEHGIESVDALMRHPIPGLNLIDIKEQKNKKEILCEVETPS